MADLRDEIAMRILQGHISNGDHFTILDSLTRAYPERDRIEMVQEVHDHLAAIAYDLSDAMLRRRATSI